MFNTRLNARSNTIVNIIVLIYPQRLFVLVNVQNIPWEPIFSPTKEYLVSSFLFNNSSKYTIMCGTHNTSLPSKNNVYGTNRRSVKISL